MNSDTSALQAAPRTFARCGNAQCPKAAECLRHWIAEHDTDLHKTVMTVNLKALPALNEPCSYFLPIKQIRVAWGVKNLFNNLPYRQAKAIKAHIIGHFGRTKYYRFYREEQYVSPEDQEYIRKTFLRYGIRQVPAFDRYTDIFKWS